MVTVSAPGSLMLLGEHAVLEGYQSLVCAINKRVTVNLKPLIKSYDLEIDSSIGKYSSSLTDLKDDLRFQFILDAVRSVKSNLETGINITIDSDIDSSLGFGSSAAVTVGVHAVLSYFLNNYFPSKEILFKQALDSVRRVQKVGSGADIAASIYGGALGYKTNPDFMPIEFNHSITAVYCGYKKRTSEVIKWVKKQFANDKIYLKSLLEDIDNCAKKGINGLINGIESELIDALNEQQKVMEKLGLNTPEIDEVIRLMKSDSNINGVKISGSGLGDCVIGLGIPSISYGLYQTHQLDITPNGCSLVEENGLEMV